MPTDRERRLAMNEAAFRVANERMRNWPERRSSDGPARYYCECSRLTCHEQVLLRTGEYEDVRANSARFVIVPGHEIAELERVVLRTERYSVIEKDEGVQPITEATDPRGG